MALPSPAPKSPLTKSNAVDPIPTPTYPSNNLWAVLATTTISAPLAAVVDASLETSTWPEWNTFVSKADILSKDVPTRLQVGTKAKFHVRMKEGGPTSSAFADHEVVAIENIERDGREGVSIIWKAVESPLSKLFLRVERVQEILELKLPDGSTEIEYKTWSTFGGPGAHVLTWVGIKNDVVARFEDWANGLKAYAETTK